MLKKLGRFLGGGVSKPIREIAGQFIAPKDTRQLNQHEYKLAVLEQFQAYTTSNKGSMFERFVGGLNALPRPLIALGTISLIGYIIIAPTEAGVILQAKIEMLNTFNTFWQGIIAGVFALYYGGRMQMKHYNAKEQSQRLENMEKTSHLIMDMIDRLDERNTIVSDKSDNKA